MTKNFLDITLSCNGETLKLGTSPEGEKREYGITKFEGLEASELQISTADNALVDGTTVEGKRIKERPVHLEFQKRDGTNNSEDREKIIKFFNPKYTGNMVANFSGTERTIDYEIEGWNFENRKNIDNRLQVVADLICPDPYWKDMSNFGKNMAEYMPLFAFPWRITKEKIYGINDPYKGMALGGQPSGYRIMNVEAQIDNGGDVPCGIQIKFVATGGTATNPVIYHSESGSHIKVNVEMKRGDILLIDTTETNQIVELNDENAYHMIDRESETFLLEVGANHLRYDADENYSNLSVYLYYTPLYLGV